MRMVLFAVLTAGLSACGGLNLLGEKGPPPRIYDLSPKSTFDPGLPNAKWQLVVEEPFASSTTNTDRIAVRTGQFEFVYYKGVRWSDRAPRMVQTRLVESFENSGRITAVGRQAIGLRSDFELLSEMREFQVLLPPGDKSLPSVWVQMNFKLVSQPAAQIVASMTTESRVQAGGDSMAHIVGAFDAALGEVLKDAVSWTLVTGQEHETNGKRVRRSRPRP